MQSTSGRGEAGGGGAEPPRTARQGGRDGVAQQGTDRSRCGVQEGTDRSRCGVQEGTDGSRYEGQFVDGLKHGKGRYSRKSGEFYEGFFYRDFKHGDALYCWPSGHKFTGKFYLNRKEGYGQQMCPDGASFQGLYHFDQRFGPGVLTYADGKQDVGLWIGERLLKLCTSVEGFSLSDFPEYVAFLQPSGSLSEPQSFSNGLHIKTRTDFTVNIDPLSDDGFVLPLGIERYSTDGDHLPLPPGRRRELDQHFYGGQWEPDVHPYQGYEREPLSTLPLQARMQAVIRKHRLLAENVGWDVAAVLSMNRESFGPKGPLEVRSELMIQHSFRGELQAVSQILQTGVVHPDVADSQGHTALIAATVNCHNDVIHLLLDRGADIDKMNSEGMSALAVCHVLYYPSRSLDTTLTETPVSKSPSLSESSPQISPVDFISTTPAFNNKSKTTDTNSHIQTNFKSLSLQTSEELTDHITCDNSKEIPADPESLQEERKEKRTEELQRSAEGLPQSSDTQMAAMKTERHVRLKTLKLLLERGADPNLTRVPVPILILAIMAGDTEAVRRLLLSGARTDIPLPSHKKGLYPLHVAAALPGPEGPKITQLLLHAVIDPDARAGDQDEIYEPDRTSMNAVEPLSTSYSPHLKEGGRTALHIACQRDSDYLNARKVVALLLSHGASTDLLWSGHSPLSLAIASGNDLAVEELLNGGADPNIPLGSRVGSALCAVTNTKYHLGDNRMKLLEMLAKAGADILMPVMVGGVVGTAVDYAHYSFNQELAVARSMLYTLNIQERERFKAQRQLLNAMSDLLRQSDGQRGRKNMEREQPCTWNSVEAFSSSGPTRTCEATSETAENYRQAVLKFCCHCGRSVSVKLTACSRCHKVFYCSRPCKNKAWNAWHKEECVHVSATAGDVKKNTVFKSQQPPRPLPPTDSQTMKLQPSETVKSFMVPKPVGVAEESQVNTKENYSHN